MIDTSKDYLIFGHYKFKKNIRYIVKVFFDSFIDLHDIYLLTKTKREIYSLVLLPVVYCLQYKNKFNLDKMWSEKTISYVLTNRSMGGQLNLVKNSINIHFHSQGIKGVNTIVFFCF